MQVVDETSSGKGRPTPSRKEALSARKQQMKKPTNSREMARRRRAERAAMVRKQRESLNSGDQRYLPRRDQGPVRTFCRDFVDRRRSVAEYLMPALVIILITSFLQQPRITAVLWSVALVGTVLDTMLLHHSLSKQLRARFPGESTKGAAMYTILRSTQLRRFRLPKPQIGRGEPLRDRY